MKASMSRETNPAKHRPLESASEAETAEELSRTASGAIERAGNVDKIRDILFGTQMRDYEKRFSRFEERLLKETSDLREEIKRRIASIEAYMKNEVTAVNDRHKADQTATEESLKELA